jgi:hypothetical protein
VLKSLRYFRLTAILFGLVGLYFARNAYKEWYIYPPCREVRKILWTLRPEGLINQTSLAQLEGLAIEHGERLLPVLENALLGQGIPDGNRWLAAYSATIVSGQEMQNLLKTATARKTGAYQDYVCATMVNTATASDIDFLVRSFAKAGDHDLSTDNPAYALRSLNLRSPLEAVQKLKNSHPSSDVLGWLSWIQMARCKVEGFPSKAENDQLLNAILEFGFPGMNTRLPFCDHKKKWILRYSDGTWEVGSDPDMRAETNHVPDDHSSWRKDAYHYQHVPIAYSSIISSDHQRAYMNFSVTWGNLGGRGYGYIFRRTGQSWSIVGMMDTWIS